MPGSSRHAACTPHPSQTGCCRAFEVGWRYPKNSFRYRGLRHFQFRYSGPSVTPGNRCGRPGVTAHHDLQGEFDIQVEVRRKKWPASVEGIPAIRFERIREIREWHIENQSQEPVG